MAEARHYEAVVIGSGQGGNPLARALAGRGRRTAVVEREHVGGTCINEGCTPTKTMVASAEAAYMARRSEDYGISTGPVSVDLSAVRQRKRDIVESFRGGNERRLQDAENLDLLMGEASFTGPRELEVRLNDGGALRLSADLVFINAGSRPGTPPVDGLDETPFLDSTSIMELDEVPERLLVLGGGYVGLEFAQMFRRFGSEVTIVQRGPQLLAREDPDVAGAMTEILREDGVEVLLGAKARSVEGDDEGVRLTVLSQDGERTLPGSHLLIATGRPPNTDTLDLSKAGVETDERGFVKVNDRLETNVTGVYALGDIKGGPAFTHVSYDDYRILEANVLNGGDASISGRILPYTVFTDPQLGRVGLGEREAREQGFDVRIAKMPMEYVTRALEVDEPRGMMKAVVDAGTQRILGCAILGIEGGEVAAMIQVAMIGGLPYTALRDAVFAHPTLSESLNSLFALVD